MRISAVAHDPGGANAIGAVVAALRAQGAAVRLWAKGPAIRRFAELAIDAEPVARHHAFSVAALDGTLLLAGTSAIDDFELDAISVFSARRLPSIAVLDYPANYRARFVRDPLRGPIWPDLVTALDLTCATAMIADGVPSGRIRVTGQPHLAWLLRRGAARRRRSSFRRRVLFASQPHAGEVEALSWVASRIRELPEPVSLTVRFHPRQTDRAPSLRCLAEAGVDATVDDHSPTITLLEEHELVFGVTSTILLEAALLGRSAASVLAPGVPDALASFRSAIGPPLTTPAAVARFFDAPALPVLDVPFVVGQRDADLKIAALCRALADPAREAA